MNWRHHSTLGVMAFLVSVGLIFHHSSNVTPYSAQVPCFLAAGSQSRLKINQRDALLGGQTLLTTLASAGRHRCAGVGLYCQTFLQYPAVWSLATWVWGTGLLVWIEMSVKCFWSSQCSARFLIVGLMVQLCSLQLPGLEQRQWLPWWSVLWSGFVNCFKS